VTFIWIGDYPNPTPLWNFWLFAIPDMFIS
jgi:hypothetical protein